MSKEDIPQPELASQSLPSEQPDFSLAQRQDAVARVMQIYSELDRLFYSIQQLGLERFLRERLTPTQRDVYAEALRITSPARGDKRSVAERQNELEIYAALSALDENDRGWISAGAPQSRVPGVHELKNQFGALGIARQMIERKSKGQLAETNLT